MGRSRRAKQRRQAQAPPKTDIAKEGVEQGVLQPQPLNRDNSRGRQLAVQTIEAYKGPVPPATFLDQYSSSISNGGERLFSLIERESTHVQTQEKTALDAQIRIIERGQNYAFMIAVVAIAGGAWAVQFNAYVAAAMIAAGVGTLAVAFLGRSKKEEK